MTRPLRRADGRLDPADRGQLERQVRAYLPWPGSFLETAAGRLVVWGATPVGRPARRARNDRPWPVCGSRRPAAGSSSTRSSRPAAGRCPARHGSVAGRRCRAAIPNPAAAGR